MVRVTTSFQIIRVNKVEDYSWYSPVFSNTVYDAGLDLLAEYTVEDIIATINIGSGTVLPNSEGILKEDGEDRVAGLEEYQSSSSTRNTGWESTLYYSDPPVYAEIFGIFTFGQGGFIGKFSELGLSRAPDSGYLNRQLIRDVFGIPRTIEVLEYDELQIACWVYVYVPGDPDDPPTPVSFQYKGETINAEATTNSTGMGGSGLRIFTGAPNNTKFQLSTESSISFNRSGSLDISAAEEYTPGTFTRKYKATHSAGDYAGEYHTLYLGWGSGGTWTAFTAYQLETPIVITEEEVFEIEFERSWGRYEE